MIPWPSARMVRAIAVIAAGVVVVAVVSLHYLGVGLPGPASPSPTPSPSSPIVAAPNVVRGPIVVFDSRHDDVAWGLQPDGTDYALSRTVDGGARWQRLARLPTIPIFATRSLGFAIIYGPSGIASGMLRTTDGGATWRPVGALPAPQASQWLQARVTFVDTRHGWLTVPTAGATDVQIDVYRTVDGGAHWVRLPSVSSTAPVPFRHMRTVADVGTTFRDPSTGWVTLTERGAAALVATGDGGRSWQELRLPQPPVPWSSSDIVSTAPPAIFGREVLVAAYDTPTTQQFGDDRSWLYTSFDGGLTWQPPRPGPDGSPANPIASGATDIEVGQGELWAVQSTDILASYDGGSSWRSIAHEPEGVNPQDVIPAGARTAWCTGSRLGTNVVQRALLRTVDGGRTWHPVRPPPMA